ncbi:hypothetical protein BVC80_521g49 [Macleaya cordata]|uniref:Uncharacterized protein n=1 Tax=Macleaya cordata TaxID=56857 RepID=A0A200R955_MACCD|nr:hypothetical protein BVC80_521g49 [Macleaya cordata]
MPLPLEKRGDADFKGVRGGVGGGHGVEVVEDQRRSELQFQVSVTGLFQLKKLKKSEYQFVFLDGNNTGGVPFQTLNFMDDQAELVREMLFPSLPDEYGGRWRVKYFGECRGHLQLINTYDPHTTRFDIFEMDTDYIGWNMKYRVDLEGLMIAHPEIVRNHFGYQVLLVEEKEESSKLVLQILDNMAIISYDLKELSFKKILNLVHDGEDLKQYRCFAYQYIETLACV